MGRLCLSILGSCGVLRVIAVFASAICRRLLLDALHLAKLGTAVLKPHLLIQTMIVV